MADPIAKIGSIDVAKLTPNDVTRPVELQIPFTIEVAGETYIHTISVVSEPLTRFRGVVTAAEIERVVKEQAARIQNIYDLAASLAPRVGVDLVAEAAAAQAAVAEPVPAGGAQHA
jgi:hypothetical protein